jgi:phage terminase large subunit-like protein
MSYKPTLKQLQATELIGSTADNILLEGGSRSGKTFLDLRVMAIRALSAPESRHAALRFRFNHIKASIIYDTWPKMMGMCFPQEWKPNNLNKTDWFYQFGNGSEVWFGGLDDKERTEKILGNEYATLYFNEVSQIPWSSILLAKTRLAQKCHYKIGDREGILRLKSLYDCNPPPKGHWVYKLFHQKRDPDSNQGLPDPDNYISMQMNPEDNLDNLPEAYLTMLKNLPSRMRQRFYEGKYADITSGALWSLEVIDKWRTISELPDMQRIVIAVDPSGAADTDNADNDEIGIIVAGLGTDGNAYVLEDLTCKAGPKIWGTIATTAFDRHRADIIVAETNYGGEMVKFVVKAAKPGVPFKKLTASRGKVVRAEPVSALTEQGKIRFAGNFTQLEDELCAFTTKGYVGSNSPNRGDAFVWAMSELFPGIIKERKEPVKETESQHRYQGPQAWMS